MIFFIISSLLILFLSYIWLIKPFIIYKKAQNTLGHQAVILIYQPLNLSTKYYQNQIKLHNQPFWQIKQLIKKKPKSKIIILAFITHTVISIIDPQFIKIIANSYQKNVQKQKFLFHQQLQMGLIFAKGDAWKQSRKILSDLFHFIKLKSIESTIVQITNKQTVNLDQKNVDLLKLCSNITGKIVVTHFLGKQFLNTKFNKNNVNQQIIDIFDLIFKESLNITYLLRVGIFGRISKNTSYKSQKQQILCQKLVRFKKIANNFIEIQKKKYQTQKVTSSGVLDTYFKLNQKNYNQQIIQHLLVFLFAGQDSTGALSSLCLYYLAEYPRYQQQILNDLKDKDLHQSIILNNFIDEVNRIHPSVANTLLRKVVQPFQLDGFVFQKNYLFFFGLAALFNNPKYFQEPEKFNPDRFNKKETSIYYIPFSTGPRNCIGQHMAKMELRVIISQILKKYRLQRTDNRFQIQKGLVINTTVNKELVKFIKK